MTSEQTLLNGIRRARQIMKHTQDEEHKQHLKNCIQNMEEDIKALKKGWKIN